MFWLRLISINEKNYNRTNTYSTWRSGCREEQSRPEFDGKTYAFSLLTIIDFDKFGLNLSPMELDLSQLYPILPSRR